MSEREDPNADLIGYTFKIEGKEWTVTGSPWESNSNYVSIEAEGEKPTVRAAGLVRKHKLSDWLVTD